MINQLLAFPVIDDCRLKDKSVRLVTEDDLEAFIKHLASLGRAASTRNHYVQLIKAMSKWVWIWTKKKGPNDKGTTKLSPESQAAYRSIDLHFHDLRHEGGSRLLEAGWPAHHVQHMLGHASLQQTSTYLNATLRGLHESMRTLEQSRAACKSVASKPTRGRRPARKQAPASDGNSLIH
jgi:integrase